MPPQRSWVQVFGRVAVHHAEHDSTRLTGSGQKLLAVLVAVGVEGASAERIAEALWGDRQPNPWRPALRMAIARLRKQLPIGWDVAASTGSYRLDTADGWVDACGSSRLSKRMPRSTRPISIGCSPANRSLMSTSSTSSLLRPSTTD